ncbi:MAG: transposase [Dethiobacter sp.]|jgi:REP element-mobilizing transposase RayT|nr:MAG: transposase [Dethiobacter sp.]
MSRHQRIKSKSGYYHVMVRGNEKRNIFNNEDDKQRFLEIVYNKKEGNRFYLHAFCLMDNHFHFILGEGTEDVAKVMKRITVSYVYYFNKKYKRVGHLFQDRFKSEVVEQDSYMLSLARYIHQNPVKAGKVKSAGEYRWSSHDCYINENNYYSKIVDTGVILELFSSDKEIAKQEFKRYMNQEGDEIFIDLPEEKEEIDEEAVKELIRKMLQEREMNCDNGAKMQLPDELIKEFKVITNLSIRKIASITGMNKDKVNKILGS